MKKTLSALVLALLSVGLVSCGSSSSAASSTASLAEGEFEFKGNITLNDIAYDVVMPGKDQAFTLNAGNLKSVYKGTYSFAKGQGYTMTFADANSTCVRTQFDTASKTFSFIYTLDLGTARGSGNLKLSYVDTSFALVGDPWNDIPSFAGNAAWFGGALKANMKIACDADNGYKVVSGEINDFTPIQGTYAYANGVYVFNRDDGTSVSSVKNAASGLQEVTMTVHRPGLEAYGAADAPTVFTQVILTV
jgi:hypothetical protein